MDERCAAAHARVLAGTCPWCGRPIINGRVIDDPFGSGDLGASLATYTDTLVDFTERELGTSLKQVVAQEGPLDWRRAVRYVAEVARQLSKVHDEQHVHRNVRPNNIFLDQEKLVELGGSGQEAMFAAINEESIPSIVDCFAPEWALDSPAVDGRADIYSLGCTFYYLLTGRMPFPNGSVAERLLKHQTATPESLSDLRPDVPAAVVRVCEKMMAKKPGDRYATGAAVVDAFAKTEAEG
jgi:serine/threonine-protein kinase